MFSLIVVIIATVLVILLVMATLYYGGKAFSNNQAQAQASAILNQSSQILAAIEAYKVDNASQLPSSMQDLVNGHYLNAAPSSSWSFATDSVQAVMTSSDSCLAADQKLGYNFSTVPLCSDPNYQNVTICCQQ